MPTTRRKSAQQPLNGTPSNGYGTVTPPAQSEPSKTINYKESLRHVPWQTDNDQILTGYRRQLFTYSACIKSAFTYLHNETVNIHTHSIGALAFAALIPLHLVPSSFPLASKLLPTPHTLHDKVALVSNLLCAVSCLGLSSWFHTVQCHSKAVCDNAHCGDYVGIVLLTTGSIIPGIYYSFHGQPILQLGYMAAIGTAGISAAYIVLSPHHRAHRWHRTLVFIALGLSAVFPVAHAVIAKGLTHARQQLSLDLILAGGVSYITGALLYAARIPERLAPGRFDFFGASHQIFHCFVLGGAGLQYAALRGMVWGRSQAIPG